GYFGYDTVRYIESRLAASAKPDSLGLPEIRLLLSDELAVVDNLSGKLHLIVYADPAAPGAYGAARRRLDDLRAALRTRAELPAHAPVANPGVPRSNIGERAFYDAVAKSKRYITDGDMMQVQISQRISQPFPYSTVNLYRSLRSINPSPYMFY